MVNPALLLHVGGKYPPEDTFGSILTFGRPMFIKNYVLDIVLGTLHDKSYLILQNKTKMEKANKEKKKNYETETTRIFFLYLRKSGCKEIK